MQNKDGVYILYRRGLFGVGIAPFTLWAKQCPLKYWFFSMQTKEARQGGKYTQLSICGIQIGIPA